MVYHTLICTGNPLEGCKDDPSASSDFFSTPSRFAPGVRHYLVQIILHTEGISIKLMTSDRKRRFAPGVKMFRSHSQEDGRVVRKDNYTWATEQSIGAPRHVNPEPGSRDPFGTVGS